MNVSYEDAITFAAWRSKRDGLQYRLPSEEEWEYAARNGIQSDLYPWGTLGRRGLRSLKSLGMPARAGSDPRQKNRWGVLDLILKKCLGVDLFQLLCTTVNVNFLKRKPSQQREKILLWPAADLTPAIPTTRKCQCRQLIVIGLTHIETRQLWFPLGSFNSISKCSRVQVHGLAGTKSARP